MLFVCSANKDRSAAAKHLSSEMWPQSQYDSASTNKKICFQLGTQYINKEIVNWADLILVMENKHKKEIIKQFGSAYSKIIKVLGIQDYYEFGNAELKEILKEKLQAYF